MITQFNKYDNLPKVGEYVYVLPRKNRSLSDAWIEHFKFNIGRILETEYDMEDNFRFRIRFDKALDSEIIFFYPDEIKFHSKDKSELKHIIQANKYNL